MKLNRTVFEGPMSSFLLKKKRNITYISRNPQKVAQFSKSNISVLGLDSQDGKNCNLKKIGRFFLSLSPFVSLLVFYKHFVCNLVQRKKVKISMT